MCDVSLRIGRELRVCGLRLDRVHSLATTRLCALHRIHTTDIASILSTQWPPPTTPAYCFKSQSDVNANEAPTGHGDDHVRSWLFASLHSHQARMISDRVAHRHSNACVHTLLEVADR